MILDCTPRQRTRRRRARLRRERCFFVTHTPQGGFSCRFAAIHLLSRQKTIKIISRLRARNFFGLYGVVQKILVKVRSGERAFSFFRRAAAGKGKFRSPRGGADYCYLPPDRCAGHQNTKSGLGRFFHICAYILILYVCGGG